MAERPPLDIATKLFYGMGTMAGAVKGRLSGLLLLFYNQLIGLPAPWVSAAIAISLFIDAFWDPIVGQVSDRTHTRWGRRHPYIYGAAIPAAICFALLFMPPHGAPKGTIFVWMLAMILGTRLFDSLNEIPASALMPELTQNYDERTNVQSYRYLFSGVIGAVVGVVLTFGVFLRGTDEDHGEVRSVQPCGLCAISRSPDRRHPGVIVLARCRRSPRTGSSPTCTSHGGRPAKAVSWPG